MRFPTLLTAFACVALFVGSKGESTAQVASPANKKSRPVALRPSSGTDGGEAAWESLLAREIGRQALLMAARDQFGLPTRDVLLRECDRAAAEDDGRLLDVRFSPVMGGDLSAVVRKLQGETKTKLAEKKTPLAHTQPMSYKPLLDFAEKLSRRECVDALKKAGFTGEPIKTDQSVRVGEDIERLLARMSIPSQYAAVRQLHQLAAKKGYSDEVTAALVRAYSNLSMFTELHWSSSSQIFKARALLYAHRLRVAGDTPFARWHRAYAWTIAGVHSEALHDLEAAKKMIAEGKPTPEASKQKPPAWVSILEKVCRFETDKSDFLPAKDAAERELAVLLAARNAELTKITPAIEPSLFDPTKYKAIRQFAEAMPHCSRLGESVHLTTNSDLHDAASLAGRRDFASTIYRELSAVKDLPAGIRRLAESQAKSTSDDEMEEFRTRAELIAGLYTAGDADTTTEPSWSMLATLIQDTTYMWCHCQSAESEDLEDAASGAMLEAFDKMLARHPYREIIQIHGINWSLRKESYASVLESLDVANVTHWGRHIYKRFPNNKLLEHFRQPATRHADDTYPGLVFMFREVTPDFRESLANQLYKVSPHAPLAVAGKIETDWKNVKKHAAEWETRYADELPVMKALGAAYLKDGKNAEAITCLKRYSDVIHDFPVYKMMDKAYRRQNDMEGVIAVWKEACRVSYLPQMLGPARVELLHALMDLGRFDDAIKAADEMKNPDLGLIAMAAECAEYNRDFSGAEKRFRKLYEIAPDTWSNVLWWTYCVRSKSNGLKNAKKAAEEFITATESEERYVTEEDLSIGGRTALMLGQKERGLKLLTASERNETRMVEAWHQMLLAVEADDQKKVKETYERLKRDGQAALKSAPQMSVSTMSVAAKVSESFATQTPLDGKRMKEYLAKSSPDECVRTNYFVGRYFELSGDAASAKSWYRDSIRIPRNCLERTMAFMRLRELGEEPNDIQVGGDRAGK